MRLQDLDSKNANPTVVLLQTPSTQLSIFLYDKLKLRFHCNSDSIVSVESKSDVKKIRDVSTTSPPFGDKWLIQVNLDKVNDKELIKVIHDSLTCIFFCTCSKYKTFKQFKDSVKDVNGVYDYYVTYIRRLDLLYLYDALVPEDNKLSKQLFDYVAQSYSSDIDAIFDLLLALNKGDSFESRKDIAELCGLGNNSVESFLLSLMKPMSETEKGTHTVIKNRAKMGADLGATIGWSSFYNFFNSSLDSFIQLKVLVVSGVVYKQVRDLPDSYDEQKLSKYNKYLWRLKEVPLSRFLRMKQVLLEGGRWNKPADFLRFLYCYYTEGVKQEVLNVSHS